MTINPREFTVKSIECVDCGVTFDFEPGEQAYYQSKGLSEPRRCKPCRDARRGSIVKADTIATRKG